MSSKTMRVIAALILMVLLGLSSLPAQAQSWSAQTTTQTETGWLERLWQWLEILWAPAGTLEHLQQAAGTGPTTDSATPTRLERGVTVDPNG